MDRINRTTTKCEIQSSQSHMDQTEYEKIEKSRMIGIQYAERNVGNYVWDQFNGRQHYNILGIE